MPNLGKYGYNTTTDVGNKMTYCLEHAHNTCWDDDNLNFIRAKLGGISYNSDGLSQSWYETTSKMFCSLCDGGIGTGALQGLCEPQCTAWYNACKHDYFTGDVITNELGAGAITFWSQNSMLCSKLGDIYSEPADFCTQMGIPQNDDKAKCYDGIPWSTKQGKGKKLKEDKQRSKKSKSKKVKEQSYFDKITELTIQLYDSHPILFMIGYGSLLALSLLYATSFILRLLSKGNQKQHYIDEDIKEKRRKILEKKAAKEAQSGPKK